jgi:hypothetical protein
MDTTLLYCQLLCQYLSARQTVVLGNSGNLYSAETANNIPVLCDVTALCSSVGTWFTILGWGEPALLRVLGRRGVLAVCGQQKWLWWFEMHRVLSQYQNVRSDCVNRLRKAYKIVGARWAQPAARMTEKVMRTEFWWRNLNESLKVKGVYGRRIPKGFKIIEWEDLDANLLAQDAIKR